MIYSVQAVLHQVPTHFIILQVARSPHAPRSGFIQLAIPSYVSDVHCQHLLYM